MDEVEYIRIYYPKLDLTDYGTVVQNDDIKTIRILKDPNHNDMSFEIGFIKDDQIVSKNLIPITEALIKFEFIDRVEFFLING